MCVCNIHADYFQDLLLLRNLFGNGCISQRIWGHPCRLKKERNNDIVRTPSSKCPGTSRLRDKRQQTKDKGIKDNKRLKVCQFVSFRPKFISSYHSRNRILAVYVVDLSKSHFFHQSTEIKGTAGECSAAPFISVD